MATELVNPNIPEELYPYQWCLIIFPVSVNCDHVIQRMVSGTLVRFLYKTQDSVRDWCPLIIMSICVTVDL